MHDIWNPWHGCKKKSEGCEHCYMYFLDKVRGDVDSSVVYKTKNFKYPLQKDREGNYKIRSGETLRVCMTSDFFVEEADPWREEVWDMIRIRKDVKFFILTKRPERAIDNLPEDIGEFENVLFNVTCENQARAEERLPILEKLPFKHKGIMCAPFIGAIRINEYLDKCFIEQVIVGGENYDGARPCHYEWVKDLYDECVKRNITFCFMETGTMFVKDGKTYNLKDKSLQAEMAYKSRLNFIGKDIDYKLYDDFYNEIPREEWFKPAFIDRCNKCGSKIICNGCFNCGKCKKES